MVNEIKEHLLVLEFNVSDVGFKLPKLKEVAKRFRDLALQKHSDKGGDDAEFIVLFNAYKAIVLFYNNMKDGEVKKYCDGLDEEEELIKKLFKDFNVCRQNKSSFTIFIETDSSFIWDNVLGSRLENQKTKKSMVFTGQGLFFSGFERIKHIFAKIS